MNSPETPTRPLPKWPVWVLLALCLAFLCVLVFGVKPWDLDISVRAHAGEKIPLMDFIKEGFWWSSGINFCFSLLLLGTCRWWLCSAEAPPCGHLPRGVYPVWFYLVLMLIVVGAGLLRAPRLTQSLWNDEEYTLRRYVFGYYHENADGVLKYHKVDWPTTLFYNRGANNHVLFSLAGKTSLKIWAKMSPHKDQPFSEAALRFPSYLAGLLGIAVVAILMASLGRPMLGLMAAFFLTLHPWHLRYSVEARGYSFLLLFTCLALFFLLKAVQGGKWRHWLAFGACQFAYMISFPGAVYFAAGLNLCAFVVLFFLHKETRCRLVFVGRLCIANLFSLMAFLLVMGPSIHQIRLYLERDISQGTMGRSWFFDIWSHLITGVRYMVKEPDVPLALGLNMMIEAHPVLNYFFHGVLPVLIVLGVLRSFQLGPVAILAVIPFFLGALFAYLHTSMTGNFLFSWYLIYLLPGLALAVFLGIEFITFQVRRPGYRNSIQAGLGLVFLAVFLIATFQSRFLIRTNDRQPLRETIAAMRGSDAYAKDNSDVLTISLGTSCRQLQSYDPRIIPLDGDAAKNLRDFMDLMKESTDRKIPMLVTYASVRDIRKEDPEILKLLEDPDLFEHVKTNYGLEEMFTFRVVRYRPKTVEPAL